MNRNRPILPSRETTEIDLAIAEAISEAQKMSESGKSGSHTARPTAEPRQKLPERVNQIPKAFQSVSPELRWRPSRSFGAILLALIVAFWLVLIEFRIVNLSAIFLTGAPLLVDLLFFSFYIFVFVLAPTGSFLMVVEFAAKGLKKTESVSRVIDSRSAELLKQRRSFTLLLRPFHSDAKISILPTTLGDAAIDSLSNVEPRFVKALSCCEFTRFQNPGQFIKTWNRYSGFYDSHVELFDDMASSFFNLPFRSELVGLGERKLDQYGGASLVPSEDEEWQRTVTDLIARSELIFLLPWTTEPILWELRYIIEQKHLYKCIIIMPPSYDIRKITVVKPWSILRKSVVLKCDARQPRGLQKLGRSFGWEPTILEVDSIDLQKHVAPDSVDRYMEASRSLITSRVNMDVSANRNLFRHNLRIKFKRNKKLISESFVSGCEPLAVAGYEVPEYHSDGCFLFYHEQEPFCLPIPYGYEQYREVLDFRDGILRSDRGTNSRMI